MIVASILELFRTGPEILWPLTGDANCDILLHRDAGRSLPVTCGVRGVVESRLQSLNVGEVGDVGDVGADVSSEDTGAFCFPPPPLTRRDGKVNRRLVEPWLTAVSTSLLLEDAGVEAVKVAASLSSASDPGVSLFLETIY